MKRLSQNKNRGAGLVTVVIVLAVSGILLSGALWLSYSHYKSVMLSEIDDGYDEELDLCAELVCMSLNEEKPIGTIASLAGETALWRFYSASFEEGESPVSDSADDYLIVPIENGFLTLSDNVKENLDWKKHLRIALYSTSWEPLAENVYGFSKDGSTYILTAPIAEESDEASGVNS